MHTKFLTTALVLTLSWTAQAQLDTGSSKSKAYEQFYNNAAQKNNAEKKEIPQWMAEFSNLHPETREEYLRIFANAKAAYREGRWVICYALLNECELIFAQNPHAWNLMASSLIEQGSYDEAEQYLRRAQAELPDNPVVLLNIANIHIGRKNYQEGINELVKILRSLPGDTSADLVNALSFRVLICHLMLDQIDEAKECVAHTRAIDDTPLYFYSQALFAMRHGDSSTAAKELSTARAIFTANSANVVYERALKSSNVLAEMQRKAKEEQQSAAAN